MSTFHRGKLVFKSFAIMAVSIAIFGCGESQSARDVYLQQTQEELSQRRAELENLVGEYEGTLLDERDKSKSRVRLTVVLSGEPYPKDGVPDETTAPTLSASISVYTSDWGSSVSTTVSFTRSNYQLNSKKLEFYSENPEGSLITEVNNGHIQGAWSSSDRGLIGSVDLQKVKR